MSLHGATAKKLLPLQSVLARVYFFRQGFIEKLSFMWEFLSVGRMLCHSVIPNVAVNAVCRLQALHVVSTWGNAKGLGTPRAGALVMPPVEMAHVCDRFGVLLWRSLVLVMKAQSHTTRRPVVEMLVLGAKVLAIGVIVTMNVEMGKRPSHWFAIVLIRSNAL